MAKGSSLNRKNMIAEKGWEPQKEKKNIRMGADRQEYNRLSS